MIIDIINMLGTGRTEHRVIPAPWYLAAAASVEASLEEVVFELLFEDQVGVTEAGTGDGRWR